MLLADVFFQFNTSTLGKSLLNDTSLKIRSAPMPQTTKPPNLLSRYRDSPDKRFSIGDLTSEAGAAASAASSVATEAATAVVSAATSGLGHLVDEAAAELEKVQDDLADELYAKLNMQQWYSVHLLDLCYGNFTPNATSAGASYNTTNCTPPADLTKVLDLSSLLNRSLAAGPFQLDLADVGLAQDVVQSIDAATAALAGCVRAVLAMYILAAASAALSACFSVWSVFAIKLTGAMFHRTKQVAIYGNLGSALAACGFLFVGSLVATLGCGKAVDEVRARGRRYGLAAYRGGRFLALSWAAFALILIVAAFWTFAWLDAVRSRRAARRAAARTERKLGYQY